MPSYIDAFGGQTVPPSEYSYVTYALTGAGNLVWPEQYGGVDLLLASIMEITSTMDVDVVLPPGNAASTGRDFLIFNTGAFTLTIKDNAGGAVATIAPGIVKYFYLKDNTTVAGGWNAVTYGAGTNTLDAGSLAGEGLKANGTQLQVNLLARTITTDYTVVAADRARGINISSGTVTVNLPQASVIEDGFWVAIRNSSIGSAVVEGFGSETIDGSLNKTLGPNEAAFFLCNGTSWSTYGYGRDVNFVFSEYVVNAAAGNVTLSSSDVSGRMIRVSGTATTNFTVTLPTIDNIYFVIVEAGMGGFNVTFKTAIGTGVTLFANQNVALYSDGTNINLAVTTAATSSIDLNDGLASAPSLRFLLDADTGLYRSNTNEMSVAAGGSQIAAFGTTAETLLANLVFFGNSRRIQGDFSNATRLNRTLFQTTTVNSPTNVGLIPNGTSQTTVLSCFGSTDPDNSSTLQLSMDQAGGLANLTSTKNGTGSYYPLLFNTNGVEQLRLTTDGKLQFSQTGMRITGDLSNALPADRLSFQSSTVNGVSVLDILPNGTGTLASFQTISQSTPTNASFLSIVVSDSVAGVIESGRYGSGTFLPMIFYTGGSERYRLSATSNRFQIETNSGTVNNRFAFQDVTPNSSTFVSASPNGSGVTSSFQAWGGSNLDNASYGFLGTIAGSATQIGSDKTGASPFLPLTFHTGGLERFRVDETGNMAFGSATVDATNPGMYFLPGANLFVTGADTTCLLLRRNSSDGAIASFARDASVVGSITVTTTNTAYNTSSDYRLKGHIQYLTGSGTFIDSLLPRTWEWKLNGERGVGFIAHELQEISPSSVTGEKDAVKEDGTPDYQCVEYGSGEMIAMMVAELQSLRRRVAELESKL